MTTQLEEETTQDKTSDFNLLDLLEYSMAIGYMMAQRGENLEDAADSGEYFLATPLMEGSDNVREMAESSDVPALKFSAEWRPIIDEFLGTVVPGWIPLEQESRVNPAG